MVRAIAFLCALFFAIPAYAAQKTKAQLAATIAAQLPSSGQGLITASILRSVLNDMVDSDQQILLVNAQTGTSYTFLSSDQGKIVTFNNASPVAVSLPQAIGSFGPGYSVSVSNIGAGTVTITPVTSTINGGSSIVVPSGQAATIVADQTANYISVWLGSGFSNIVPGAGVATWLATPTSANLRTAVATTSTGTGDLVFNTSPTLITPALGTPASGTLTNATGLPITTGVAGLGAGVSTFLATPSSANLASALTDETGTGAAVFANTPTLVTPNIGAATGTSVNLTGGATAAAFSCTAPVTQTAATHAMAVTDCSLIANRGGSITVTLLSAATYPGRWFYVKTITNNTLVSASSNVVPRAGGAAGTAILSGTAGNWAALQSDGTNWVIMMGN